MYLIPVKMFLGQMPTAGLLKKYQLTQFSKVVDSVRLVLLLDCSDRELFFREGNLQRLDEALETHEQFFIECGIFLMLEKLKIITYRTLFKKV